MKGVNIFTDAPEIDKTADDARDRAYAFIIANNLYDEFHEFCHQTSGLQAHDLCIKTLCFMAEKKSQ